MEVILPHSVLSKGCTSGSRFADIFMENILMIVSMITKAPTAACGAKICRLRLKYDSTRAETRFRLSAKRTSPFKSAAESVSSVDYWQPRCAHQR